MINAIDTSKRCRFCRSELYEVDHTKKHTTHDTSKYPSGYHTVELTFYKECGKCSRRFGPFSRYLCPTCGGKLNEVDHQKIHASDGKGFSDEQYPSGYHEIELTYYTKCEECDLRFGPFKLNYLGDDADKLY